MKSILINDSRGGIKIKDKPIFIMDTLEEVLKNNQEQMSLIDQRLGFDEYELSIESQQQIRLTFFHRKLDFIGITTLFENSNEVNDWVNSEIGNKRLFIWGELKIYKEDFSSKFVVLLKRHESTGASKS